MKQQKKPRMSSLTQKKLRGFFLGLLLFAVPLVAAIAINIHPSVFLSDTEVVDMQREMAGAALRYQNKNGLFIETSIDHVYRAVTVAPLVQNLSDPIVQDTQGVINFIWARQTPGEGGFSDVAMLGNMEDTYKVIKTIASLNATFLNRTNEYYRYVNQGIYLTNENKTDWLLNFLNKSYIPDAGGFSAKANVNQPDIVSTWQALELYKIYNQSWITDHEGAIYNYTASLLAGNGSAGFAYRYSNITFIPDPRSTYAGLRVRALINRPLNGTEGLWFPIYLNSLQSPVSGGYAPVVAGIADLQSTYHCLAGLILLGSSPLNTSGCEAFISNCLNPDGGFGATPAASSSDFASGWAAFQSANITNYTIPQDVKNGYAAWLIDHRALNSLFGFVTLAAIHDGLQALAGVGQDLPTALANLLSQGIETGLTSPMNITLFVEQCYNNLDAGYGMGPGRNSTLKGTYLAVDTLRMLASIGAYGSIARLPAVMDYVIGKQMDDGGFKIGEDLDNILGMFTGESLELYEGIINENLSSVETSYWAILALRDIRALNLSVDFENSTAYNRTALTLWVQTVQNPDGGFSSILAFKSEIVGTYHALELLDLLGASPHSVVSAVEFLRQAQTDAGGFFLAPFFAEYLGGVALFTLTYYGATSLHEKAYSPDNWLKMMLWAGLCIDTINHGVGDIPLFGSDLRNIWQGIELLGWITRVQSFDPAPWTLMLVMVMVLLAVILVSRGLGRFFEKLGLLVVRSSRSRSIEKIVYGKSVPAVQVSNLSITAGGKRIIENVSLTIDHGEILGVLGESGAGKSTFVKALLGMRKFTGTNMMYGIDVKRSARRLRPLYGYVPQDLSKIYLNFTVMENLVYFGEQYGLFEKEILKRGEKLLRNLGIADKADEQVKNLSGGQKRRVSIAIALIHDPIFCILDEPTSGLDPVVRESLWLRLVEINEQFGTTFIVITHYPEESRYCDKVAIFGRKRGMIDFGNPAALLKLLPGNGRAISLQFGGKQENALATLRVMEGIDSVLEKKDGEHFTVFSDESVERVKDRILSTFGKDSIKALMQVDVEMEDYFRYKSLEALIDK